MHPVYCRFMTLARLKKALARGRTYAHWSLVRPNKSLVPDVGLSDLSSHAVPIFSRIQIPGPPPLGYFKQTLFCPRFTPIGTHTLCAPSKLTQLRPWPIQSFGISIQFRPALTLLSDSEIGCAFINADVAKTVTGDWRYLWWCRSVWPTVLRQYVKDNRDLIFIKYQRLKRIFNLCCKYNTIY